MKVVDQPCQCGNPNCELHTELPMDVAREIKSNHCAVIVRGCKYGSPTSYKLIRRRDSYDIYTPDLQSIIESGIETAEIANDPEFMASFRQSLKDMEEGKGIPWEEVKRELFEE